MTYDNIFIYNVITMIRTQISLSSNEYTLAKRHARNLGISLAELLRKSLRLVLPVNKDKPWMKYAGFVDSGDPHSSQNIDEIVYGQKD